MASTISCHSVSIPQRYGLDPVISIFIVLSGELHLLSYIKQPLHSELPNLLSPALAFYLYFKHIY